MIRILKARAASNRRAIEARGNIISRDRKLDKTAWSRGRNFDSCSSGGKTEGFLILISVALIALSLGKGESGNELVPMLFCPGQAKGGTRCIHKEGILYGKNVPYTLGLCRVTPCFPKRRRK